ncbi:MAG: HTH-type transcriptional activator IlvY [Treponema sp.]|nr:HTH-type transcriptional activator IlvY [Treponema sp.]
MDFYELDSFIKVAETLHFSKAADLCAMSPSALSRMIARLEEEVGAPLLDRDNRKVILTERGKKFLAFAKEAVSKRRDLLADFSQDKDAVSGDLNVYASVTACYTILPPFIKELSKKYPAIRLSVQTGGESGAFAAVKEGRVLLAVAAIPEEGNAAIEATSVIKTPLIYAASADGPWTKLDGSPQDIVSTAPLVLPKTGLARKRFDKWIKSRNVKPKIAAETEGNEALLAIAQLGLGIALVPRIVLENGPYKGKFVIHEAGNALGYYDVGFIRKKEISGTQSERKLRSAVDEILSDLEADFK